jgi:hypothetical protein
LANQRRSSKIITVGFARRNVKKTKIIVAGEAHHKTFGFYG